MSVAPAFRVPELPHRVTFLAPLLTLPQGANELEATAAQLLLVTLFEHLVRHPSVSMTDPDDFRVTDDEERLVSALSPLIAEVRRREFQENRRDELLWFVLSLDTTRPAALVLFVERHDGQRRQFTASGPGALSEGIESCLAQWLTSIKKAPAPRRLEAFGAGDFLDASARALATVRSRSTGEARLAPPARLRVPYLRLIYVLCNIYTFEEILAVEPDNAWAIRDRFIAGLHADGPTTRDPIRAALESAPMFGKLYLSMFGEGVNDDEKLRSFSMAALLIPRNSYALKDYGYALNGAQRWTEALRYAERACERAPWMLDAHLLALEVVDLCRYGQALRDATRRVAFLAHLAEEDVVRENDPTYLHCQLRHSSALMRAGRLEEAIALRGELLEGLESSWTAQTKVLTDWQSDPELFAQLYAREGAMRGDPGRVVEGFAAAPPDSGSELAMLVEAFLALGEDEQALLAYAHRSRTNLVQFPIARLAGAKAYLANGDLAGAVDCIQGSALRFPGAGWDTAHDRLLRVAASRPLAEWEAIVARHLAAGARRLARQVARDAADFVPGIPASSPVVAALAGSRPVAFEARIFAELRESLAAFAMDPIDAFFQAPAEATLRGADRLANDWLSLVPPQPDEPTAQDQQVRAAKLLWIFASSFGRYLAATTQAPNVLSGGYRQIASEALEALRSVQGVLPRHVLRFFLGGLERLAPHADVWLLDTWLLRLERALDLEMTEGHLRDLAAGLPTVDALLRGDEQVGYELYLAYRTQGPEALALLERSVRAVGRGPAPRWSEIAASTLPPQERLDLHLTAAFVANNFAGPAVEAAKILLQNGGAAHAFEALCTSFAMGGKQWRERQLATLTPLWNAAGMPCPIDFQACFDVGMKAFQQGNMPLALAAHRWLSAVDPGNDQLWKNLGMAYGYVGQPAACIGAFARASVVEAPKWAGQLLRQAKHLRPATAAYRYASHWFTSGEEWSYLAVAAAVAEDYETAADAYERALELDPQLATVSHLNTYADALHEIRAHARALAVAGQLATKAAKDPVYGPNASFHQACALVGMSRYVDAMPFARDALARNTLPDNAKLFAEVVAQAEQGRPHKVATPPSHAPERQAARKLARGEHAAVAALERSAANWKLARVALAANRFRFDAENDVAVTPRHLAASLDLLARTAGETGFDASLCRLDALTARENQSFPVDPPCPLGTRIPREEFARIFAQKSGRGGVAATAAAAAAAHAASSGADVDPEIFAGRPLPRLSDYARVMKGMQSGNVQGALSAAGLDMASYGQVAMAWGQKLAQDPVLAAKLQKLMTT